MVAYLYDFNGTDTTSGVPTPTGHPTLEEVSGTWRRLSNRAYTSTARTSSPILAATLGGGDADLSAAVSSGGGDALYVRVKDASNWIRARVRKYTTSTSVTEYEWEGTTTTADGHTHTYTKWSTSQNNSPFVNAVGHSHDSYSQHTHSETQGNSYLTGNTRQGSGSATAYQVIVDKSTAGTVTTLGTASISAPSTLRVRAQGTSIQAYVNGSGTASVTVTETAFTSVGRHGIGRGPSDQDGQALDNLSIDPLNSPPNAPILFVPAVLNRNNTNRLTMAASDPDPGDSTSKSFWRYKEAGTISTWTVVSKTSPDTWYDFPSGTWTAADWEIQGATRDAAGAPVNDADLVWSSSVFFTAADAPDQPTITDPINGQTIGTESYTGTISAPSVDESEWRLVADNDGVIDETTVLHGPFVKTSGDLRSHTFGDADDPAGPLVNGVPVWWWVRTKFEGLWSEPATIRTPVSYLPPETPVVEIVTDALAATMRFTVTNPTPTGDAPATAYNNLHIRETGRPETEMRVATQKAPNSTITAARWVPASGVDYEARAEAVATNGTTASSEWTGAATKAIDYYFGGGYA